jgi:hypothetical protein
LNESGGEATDVTREKARGPAQTWLHACDSRKRWSAVADARTVWWAVLLAVITALIALKRSPNAQFQDKPGACKLIETAVNRGDQTMKPRVAECRAN